MSREVFALDIGTRKVMGLVALQREDMLEILDAEMIEHASRPMLDGQIHGIEEVARSVRAIKQALESRLGRTLRQVGVAVAGRNLQTFRSRVCRNFETAREITAEMVKDMELEAVDSLHARQGVDLSRYYCVGYSPVGYELDGNRIFQLAGHSGRSISADLLVTCLPRIVLDSIFSVLKRTGLEAVNITLEPIAAMEAIVPGPMRNLNLVLVDVGAGTSDVAVSRNGMVCAYGMVCEAGDEITEHIAGQLLVEFPVAEQLKRQASSCREIAYEDIWGRKQRMDCARVQELTLQPVQRLAAAVARLSLELNAGAPQAVIMVGGGSQSYGLSRELARGLSLPEDKVGIRLPRQIADVRDRTGLLSGPEAVTPIGIARMTSQAKGLRFISLEVNGARVHLLDFHQRKDILGALTASGVLENNHLYPRPGLSLTVQVAGEFKIVKGTLGETARILRNGRQVLSLAEKVEPQDKLEFYPAVAGQDARARVRDVVNVAAVRLIFNGRTLELLPPVLMNGQRVRLDTEVTDRAVLETVALSARDVLCAAGVACDSLIERPMRISVNGASRQMAQRNFSLTVNGRQAGLDAPVEAFDELLFDPESPGRLTVKDVVELPPGMETLTVNVDGRDVQMSVHTAGVLLNGLPAGPDAEVCDGSRIEVRRAPERTVMLSEIFKYVTIDVDKILGKRMRILVNDTPAGFTTNLNEGSRVRILFEERD